MAKISNENIALAIHKSLKDKVGSGQKEGIKNVVNFLARRRLFSQAPNVLRRLEKIVDHERGALRVKLSSPKSLGTQAKHDLIKKLEHRYHAKEIIFEENTDAGLLGGFKLEMNDEVIDLTLKNKIKKLEEHLK